MATRPIDGRIDQLYQLPLDEFTVARNALAKEAGADGSEIRRLQKPPAAAWAINQVYWSRRQDFDALTAAASALRAAHADVLAGKRADLRAAGKAHEEALDAMLKSALAILASAGQPASDATKQAIANTLRALPGSGDPPGRLSRTLQPGGFELLAGLPVGAGSARGAKAPPPAPPPARRTPPDGESRAAQSQRANAIAKAKDAAAETARVEKAAEQTARRDEFEAARTVRDHERAEKQLADARAALERAQEAVDEAEEAATAAARKKDSAARRVRESADALARARVRTQTAQAELGRLEGESGRRTRG
jgi:hypothetical protein